jgi:predicted O-methyltransferase YrrM
VQLLQDILADESNHNSFDFGFIDANKEAYPTYYEGLVQLMKPGGFIIIDNSIWGGEVAKKESRENDVDTKAIYDTVQTAL